MFDERTAAVWTPPELRCRLEILYSCTKNLVRVQLYQAALSEPRAAEVNTSTSRSTAVLIKLVHVDLQYRDIRILFFLI